MEKSSEPCPKCGKYSFVGSKECLSCGLVFKRWEEQSHGGHVNGSQRLEMSWQSVLNAWESPQLHENFIQQAVLEHNLPFASLKYRRILDADPNNEVALRRKEQVLQLVMATFMASANEPSALGGVSRSTNMLLIVGVFLIFIGMATPESISGVGRPFMGIGFLCMIGSWLLRRL